MRIFDMKPLSPTEVDFTNWETINGDKMLICRMRQEYIERLLGMLDSYLNRYPNHPNKDIWEQYIEVMEEELESRL